MPPKLYDSPWLWVSLFGAAAFFGIWAISSKYEVRERRIEMKFAGRREANERIARGEAVDPRTNIPTLAPNVVAERTEDFDIDPAEVQNAKTLGFLKWLAAGAAIVGAGMFVWERRAREAERPATETSV